MGKYQHEDFMPKAFLWSIFVFFQLSYSYAYHGVQVSIEFRGWTVDSKKCAFLKRVVDSASDAVVNELIVVDIFESSASLTHRIFMPEEMEGAQYEFFKKQGNNPISSATVANIL